MKNKKLNVGILVGTRPEVIKLIMVYKALKNDLYFNPILILTGQHNSEMTDPILDFFEESADERLNLIKSNKSINIFISALISKLDSFVQNRNIDLLIVQGDTNSSMAGAIVAFMRGIKIAHVEAGLRTYNRASPYPEETNRRIISLVSDYHFVPTESAAKNILSEKLEGDIHIVGNTVIDSVLEASKKIDLNEKAYTDRFSDLFKPYARVILVTGHRRENIQENFDHIFNAIKDLATKYPNYSFVLPVHTNPKVAAKVNHILNDISNIHLLKPLPYDEFIYLMKQCHLIMTDSGGLQEEGPALNKPVMVLRDTTERPEGIKSGCSVLAGVDRKQIVDTFENIINNKEEYKRMSEAYNPYGSGDTSQKILQILKQG